MHLVHVITGLDTGGAEMMLYKLLSALDQNRFRSSVISLIDSGPMGARIESLGVPVFSIGIKRSLPTFKALSRLVQYERELKPDILQGWMYHGNIAASLLSFFSKRSPGLLWNIRHALDDIKDEKLLVRMMIRTGAVFSPKTDGIVYNSKISANQHMNIGYSARHTHILPNGFDLTSFKSISSARVSVRGELGLSNTDILVGVVARYHPVKGHNIFLQAVQRVHAVSPAVSYLLVGQGTGKENQELSEKIDALGLDNSFYRLGEREDIAPIMSALDILVCPSLSEAFPNVIGEAMACEVPCIATDVGDSSYILTGISEVVPARDPEKLAAAILDLVQLGRENRKVIGRKGRRRIAQNFSLPVITSQYEHLYQQLHECKTQRLT